MAPWPKHLVDGDPCPELSKDKLTVFNMRFCPFAQRAILVCEAKDIKYDMVNVTLRQGQPSWFKADKNPLGKVPTVQKGDDIVYDSVIVAEYLDEAYPGSRLLPDCPLQRAQDKMFKEHYGDSIMIVYTLGGVQSEEDLKKPLENFNSKMDYFEQELVKRGTKFLGGSEGPMLVDYLAWPFFERFEALPLICKFIKDPLPESRFPKLNQWIKDMKEDKAVKSYRLEPQVHADFLISMATGDHKPIYDP